MKTIKLTGLLTMLTIVLFSCGKKPSGETVEASEAKEVASTADPVQSINTTESYVSWIGYKPTGKHNGTFDIKSGAINYGENGITGGEIIIDMQALTVVDIPVEEEGNAKLKGHLMSPDFFATDSFPTAKFVITGVKAYDGVAPTDKEEYKTDFSPIAASAYVVEGATHTVTGNLTIKGVSKSISFPTKVIEEDGRYHALATFNIDRMDWGIAYGDENSAIDKAKDKFVYNTVSVGFDLITKK